MTDEADLIAAGWEKQTTYDDPRLTEFADTYRELGFEVRLEPLPPTDSTSCTECLAHDPGRFRTIWTRRPPGGNALPTEE